MPSTPATESELSTPGAPAPEGSRRSVLALVLAATSFVLAAWGTAWAISRAADRAGVTPGLLRLNAAAQIADRVTSLPPRTEPESPRRVFLLGDSTVQLYPEGDGLTEHLQAEWHRKADEDEEIAQFTYAGPGLGPRAFYFLADVIAAGEPDVVLWEVSFTHTSDHWRRNAIEDFTGWLELVPPPEALWTALDVSRVTLDELLLNRLLVRTGWMEPWRALKNEQSRAGKLLGVLDDELDGERPSSLTRFGFAATRTARLRTLRSQSPDRFNLRGARTHFGPALEGLDPEHPMLVLVGATVRRLVARGSVVLVYLNPINVENLEAVGALRPGALEQGAAAFRAVVEESGASFLDLHAKFGDRYFADSAGHFVQERDVRAAEELAVSLTAALRRLLRETEGAD